LKFPGLRHYAEGVG